MDTLTNMSRPALTVGGLTRRLLAGFVLVVAASAGCAAPAAIAVPAELPLTTREDNFDIRWALQREASVVRGVGVVHSLAGREVTLTLGFFGLDESGRIVSRGTTPVRFRFARDPAPFEVTLTPTGREARFELHVIETVFMSNPFN